jgi:hypothetical protein
MTTISIILLSLLFIVIGIIIGFTALVRFIVWLADDNKCSKNYRDFN